MTSLHSVLHEMWGIITHKHKIYLHDFGEFDRLNNNRNGMLEIIWKEFDADKKQR